MSIIQAIILGIIQGATEFLPISSSGHLSLAQHFMGLQMGSLLFDVMLHLGTLLAVLAVYYKLVGRLIYEFVMMLKDIFTGKFKWSQMNADRRMVMMLIFGLLPLFLLFLPIPGTEMKIKDLADQWSTDNSIIVEGFSLIGTSILLTLGILATKRTAQKHNEHRKKTSSTGGRRQYNGIDALSVGFIQCFAALFPGLSRSGSTLSVGLMRGINRQAALDYSFILGIPAIVAAALLSVKDAMHETAAVEIWPMIIGVITAAIIGFLAIKILRWMVNSNKLGVFAWYTFILGVAVAVIGFIELKTGTNLFTGIKL